MILDHNTHEDNIDDKEAIIDIINLVKNVLAHMLDQETVVGPNWKADEMDRVDWYSQHSLVSCKWCILYDSIVNANEWNQTHVPKEVLFRNHLIEYDKGPGLNQHGEEQIIVKQESCA